MSKRNRAVIRDRMEEDKTRIAEKVMRGLGRPPACARIDVINVFGWHYRVNIIIRDFLATEYGHRRIAHSFFVTEYAPNLDLESDPPIRRVYR